MFFRFVLPTVALLAIALSPIGSIAQEIPWTPQSEGDLQRVKIEVPPAFSALNIVPGTHDVFLPEGWTAKIFFAGTSLDKPRYMSFGPDSVLFVANMNKNNILALPDEDKDGIADRAIVVSTSASYCHDIRFYRDTMFICAESGVFKLWRSSGSGYVYDQRVTIVNKAEQPNQIGGNHRTRTLVLDTLRMKLYVSVGSRGNADRESDRGVIEEYNWDGTGRRVYASGVRNAVGMALHPRTGALWANNNGSDLQGNNVPPEWVDLVRENGFYGYPYAYHLQNFFDLNLGGYANLKPLTAADSANVARMVAPAALVAAHSAPMALVFAHDGMPDGFRKGAFMALRGSWNRAPVSGTKIVYLDFDNDEDTIANVAVDFCRGFLIDSNNNATRWARPVGVALASDGSVFISSDDMKEFILKLSPPRETSVGEHGGEPSGEPTGLPGRALQIDQRHDEVVVTIPDQWTSADIQVVDLQGSVVAAMMAQPVATFNARALPSGRYVVRAISGSKTMTGSFTIAR